MTTVDRVTILGLNYTPEPTGNAPYTTALARHLVAQGSDVTVVTAMPHYPQWSRYAGYSGWRRIEDDQGAAVVRLWHLIPKPPRGLRRLVSELTYGARASLTSWRDPDIVILVSPALFASAIAMVRLTLQRRASRVVWVQDLYSQGMKETGQGGGMGAALVRMVERWTLRRAHRVVAIHETMASRLVASLGVAPERVSVIPNWSHIVPTTLEPEEARGRLGWPQRFTVLHAGNIGVKQGLQVAVEAALLADSLAVDLQFILMGDGSERDTLRDAAAGLERITFVDPVQEHDFPIALEAADVLLVTEASGVAEMSVPSKLTSYFAASRPVVASVSQDGIVASVMAESGAGRVVPNGDARALLDAVLAVAASPATAAENSTAAHAYWATNLGPSIALRAWEAILDATNLEQDDSGEAA